MTLSPAALAAMARAASTVVDAAMDSSSLVGHSSSPVSPLRAMSAADAEQARLDLKLRLLVAMVRAITGREVRMIDTSALAGDGGAATGTSDAASSDAAAAAAATSDATAAAPAGPAVTMNLTLVHTEAERTSFSAAGKVTTADGRVIEIGVSLSMSRELTQKLDITARNEAAMRLQDPLVINFAGHAAQLTQSTFAFDLDADGTAEQVHALAEGSGLLALDTLGDGVIHDGSQLVGQKSGDAFADLRAADSDGNGWIDEADAVYSRLRLWTPGADGKGQLLTLSEAGVGAIAVQGASAAFDLRAGGQLAGRARAAGVYLAESGEAGTVQQVDLAV